MASKKRNDDKTMWLVIIAIVAIGFVFFSVKSAMKGPGSIESEAMRSTTLTASDDPLSLQQDLRILEWDETKAQENELNTGY